MKLLLLGACAPHEDPVLDSIAVLTDDACQDGRVNDIRRLMAFAERVLDTRAVAARTVRWN